MTTFNYPVPGKIQGEIGRFIKLTGILFKNAPHPIPLASCPAPLAELHIRLHHEPS
jgi:hypothetical protein